VLSPPELPLKLGDRPGRFTSEIAEPSPDLLPGSRAFIRCQQQRDTGSGSGSQYCKRDEATPLTG
jgi:hypothetical protein